MRKTGTQEFVPGSIFVGQEKQLIAVRVEIRDLIGVVSNLLPGRAGAGLVLEWRDIKIFLVLHAMNYKPDHRFRGRRGVDNDWEIVLKDFYVRAYAVAENQRVFLRIGSERMPICSQLLVLCRRRSIW